MPPKRTHSIEQIMDLASNDELPKIHSKLAIWNSVGDAEDYVHISIEYANGLLCELECNPADAYNDSPLFYLYSTRGTTKVFPTRILVKYYLDGESPISVLDHKSLLIAHTALSDMKKRLHSTPTCGTLSVKSPTVFITLCMTTYSTAENCS